VSWKSFKWVEFQNLKSLPGLKHNQLTGLHPFHWESVPLWICTKACTTVNVVVNLFSTETTWKTRLTGTPALSHAGKNFAVGHAHGCLAKNIKLYDHWPSQGELIWFTGLDESCSGVCGDPRELRTQVMTGNFHASASKCLKFILKIDSSRMRLRVHFGI